MKLMQDQFYKKRGLNSFGHLWKYTDTHCTEVLQIDIAYFTYNLWPQWCCVDVQQQHVSFGLSSTEIISDS